MGLASPLPDERFASKPRGAVRSFAPASGGRTAGLRMRVEVPGLFGDEARARRLERRLRELPGVRAVHASARTGRALIALGTEKASPRVLEIVAAEADPAGPEAPSLGRMAERARAALAGALRGARSEVRRRAGGGSATPAREDEVPASPPYHAWSEERALRELDVDPAVGLAPAEAEARRLAVGPNVLAGIAPRGHAAMVAGQALTVPNAILAAAAGASALLGDRLEAAVIGAVVVTNVAVGYFTERRAEDLLHAWGELRGESARVLRDGREVRLPAAEVVPGDVLVLRAGDDVAADARIVAADDLSADESTLTGESEPAEKQAAPVPEEAALAERDDMVYAGTAIAGGSGRAVVAATGERTELGAVRRALSRTGKRAAPLEQQLDGLGKQLSGLSALAACGVVGLGLLRGRPADEVARSAVALGVAAIPEGIPTAGTTALALASRKLFRRGIVIRRLAAAETLGAVSAVCADKTGTLTLNRMRVEEVALPGDGVLQARWEDGSVTLDGAPSVPDFLGARTLDDSVARALSGLARVAALNADVEIGEDGAVRRGSGTERALYEFAVASGFPARRARRRARRVREERRSAEHPFMVTVHEDPELGLVELMKGAPEPVVELCDLPDEEAGRALSHNDVMASHGLRVLACAWRRACAKEPSHRWVFLGLVGLRDPPRPGVREAIAALRNAGIRTTMLTGDQERTAQAVAASLGIDAGAVHSRVTPEDKVRVVRELLARGEVVAMTGDGVNDGPALQAADVGIAMGMRGTDVARAVADVVLARDDLSAIADAVAEGRRLYDNVRRAIDYLVATNMSEVLVMLLGGLARGGPLSPLQLLWLNMLTDVVPALALAAEPAEPGVMARPPRDPGARIFGAGDYLRLGRASAGMAATALSAWVLGALAGGRGAEPRAMAFTALASAQILHTLACRAGAGAPAGAAAPLATRERDPNPALSVSLGAAVAVQVAGLSLPPLRAALSIGGTGAAPLCAAALAGAVPAVLRWARTPDEIVIERSTAHPTEEPLR